MLAQYSNRMPNHGYIWIPDGTSNQHANAVRTYLTHCNFSINIHHTPSLEHFHLYRSEAIVQISLTPYIYEEGFCLLNAAQAPIIENTPCFYPSCPRDSFGSAAAQLQSSNPFQLGAPAHSSH